MTKANGKQRKISKFTAKGGVGKSSILENIAAYLALMEYKVLFIECDMQRNVSKILPEPPEYNLNDVIIGRVSIQQAIYQARENFFILPADRNLDKAANHIVVNGRKAYDSLKSEKWSMQEAIQRAPARAVTDFEKWYLDRLKTWQYPPKGHVYLRSEFNWI